MPAIKRANEGGKRKLVRLHSDTKHYLQLFVNEIVRFVMFRVEHIPYGWPTASRLRNALAELPVTIFALGCIAGASSTLTYAVIRAARFPRLSSASRV